MSGCDEVRDIEVTEVEAVQAVEMAYHAEMQVRLAPTQALRDYWVRAADYWWGKA